jgi:hypothetical protein
MNTRQRVAVVQKMMNIEMMTKETFCWSERTWLSGAPMMHIMTEL